METKTADQFNPMRFLRSIGFKEVGDTQSHLCFEWITQGQLWYRIEFLYTTNVTKKDEFSGIMFFDYKTNLDEDRIILQEYNKRVNELYWEASHKMKFFPTNKYLWRLSNVRAVPNFDCYSIDGWKDVFKSLEWNIDFVIMQHENAKNKLNN